MCNRCTYHSSGHIAIAECAILVIIICRSTPAVTETLTFVHIFTGIQEWKYTILTIVCLNLWNARLISLKCDRCIGRCHVSTRSLAAPRCHRTCRACGHCATTKLALRGTLFILLGKVTEAPSAVKVIAGGCRTPLTTPVSLRTAVINLTFVDERKHAVCAPGVSTFRWNNLTTPLTRRRCRCRTIHGVLKVTHTPAVVTPKVGTGGAPRTAGAVRACPVQRAVRRKREHAALTVNGWYVRLAFDGRRRCGWSTTVSTGAQVRAHVCEVTAAILTIHVVIV